MRPAHDAFDPSPLPCDSPSIHFQRRVATCRRLHVRLRVDRRDDVPAVDGAKPASPAEPAFARRFRFGRFHGRRGTQTGRRDHARNPHRSRLHRRPAASRVLAHRLGSARRGLAPAGQHHGRHRPAFRLGALSRARSRGQRVRAAGRLRRRQSRADRHHLVARRARLGARPRDVARHAAPHGAQPDRELAAFPARPGGAGARRPCRVAQHQPRRDQRRRRRHAGGNAAGPASTSRATSSARPTASASR